MEENYAEGAERITVGAIWNSEWSSMELEKIGELRVVRSIMRGRVSAGGALWNRTNE
jgi:hypothetical protein